MITSHSGMWRELHSPVFNSMHSDSPSDAMLWISVRFMAPLYVMFQESESSISGTP